MSTATDETAAERHSADVAATLHRDRQQVRAALERAGLRLADFQRHDPAQSVRYVMTCWAGVAGLAALWSWIDGPLGLLLALPIAVVQHAMLNVTHEASHFSLLRNRPWNDRIGNLLAALPIAHSVASYRITHVDHHNYLRSPADPSSYVTRPDLTSAEIRRTLLQLLLGRLVFELAMRVLAGRRIEKDAAADGLALQQIDRRRLLGVGTFHLAALAAFTAAGIPAFWILWLVTVMTLTPTLDGIRTIVEHRWLPGEGTGEHTRSHHRSLVVSGLMAPFFQYHWEHHLFPGIPHHGLARLHATLIELEVPHAAPASTGFFGTLWRLV